MKVSQKIYSPSVSIADADSMDKTAAKKVISTIKQNPEAIIVLSTGNTPLGLYALLVQENKRGAVDFSKVTVFFLDEYWPIKPSHPASYAYYIQKNLLSKTNANLNKWHVPNGIAENPDESAKVYETLFLSQGRPDLAILGIGPGKTCHIGFNEPGSEADSHTRYITLNSETAETNKINFENNEEMPKGAITLGIANILSAKNIILMAKGKSKAWGIKRSLTGPINSKAPASFLRYHSHVTFLLDKEASSLIV